MAVSIPRRRIARAALGLAATLLFVPSARADLAASLAKVRQAEAGVTTIRAAFVQEKRIALFAEPLVSTGTLAVVKPDRFLWTIDAPDRSAFVLEGTRARTVLPGGKSQTVDVSRFRQVSDVMREMSDLFLGRVAEGKMFRIEDRTKGSGPIALTLVPTDDRIKKYFTRIEVGFAPDARSVETIRFAETSGDATTLRFSRVVLNEPIDVAKAVRDWERDAR
jgi:outer membrane lipoprotein-sorting protein